MASARTDSLLRISVFCIWMDVSCAYSASLMWPISALVVSSARVSRSCRAMWITDSPAISISAILMSRIRKMIHIVEGFLICFIAFSSEAGIDTREICAIPVIRLPCTFPIREQSLRKDVLS